MAIVTKNTLTSTLCSIVLCLGLTASSATASTILGLAGANSFGNYLGEPIAPYNGTLNGVAIASGMICLDITIPSSYNSTWTVNTASATSVTDQRAAYLALQLFNATAATRGALTMAIWYLEDQAGTSAHVPNVQADTATMSYVNAANSATLNASMFTNLVIYSPTNTTNQRFMALTTSAVPEPGSLFLLAGGAVVMFRFRKRFGVK